MKQYAIVNLIGAAKDKVTLIFECEKSWEIKHLCDTAGYSDYKILNDWKFIKATLILK